MNGAGDPQGSPALLWEHEGPRKYWTWFMPGLPGMTLRAHFGGTFIQVAALCSAHKVGLQPGGSCFHCDARPETDDDTVHSWAFTFPLDRLSPADSRGLVAVGLVPFLEDFAGTHCDLLTATIRAHELVEHVGELVWALHPWVSPYTNFRPDRPLKDPLARFQAESLHRQKLWEELLVLWPRGLARVGSRDYTSVIDGLLR